MGASEIGGVHPVEDHALGNTSYLVVLGDGQAAVVDAPRDVVPHLEFADALGVRIVAALETHLHADFVSGSRELAEAVGAEVVAPVEAGLLFGHRAISEEGSITIGGAGVHVLHTPGHTPEHVSYVFDERSAVFSGGSLIAGGAARTDLIAPEMTDELARAQFQSLRRLAELPGDTTLFPTHGAGSFCSAGPASSGRTTIAAERAANPLLAIDDEDTFVRTLLAGYGSFPPYFLHLRDVNRRGPTLVRDLTEVRGIDPNTVRSAADGGAWIVDARPIGAWAKEHPEGAVSIELRPAFASWLGWVVPYGADVVLVVDEADLDEALREARRISYDRVVGRLDGGVEAWHRAGLPVRSTEELSAADALQRMDRGATLVDVRQESEYRVSRLTGAKHLELGAIIGGAIPDEAEEVVTFCAHGERAATAAALLEQRGLRTSYVAGGLDEWAAAGRPFER